MRTIVICAGHHINAKGATNVRYNLNEYDEATKVVNILKKMLPDFKVYVATGTLSQKVQMINLIKPNLALDIHFNADSDSKDPNDLDDSRGRGCEVMYNPGSETRKIQATKMSASMSKFLSEIDRGGHEGWYWGGSNPGTTKDYFLEKTICPAFIPEPGFIDNNAFAEKFLVNNNHEKIAQALKIAIEGFFSN